MQLCTTSFTVVLLEFLLPPLSDLCKKGSGEKLAKAEEMWSVEEAQYREMTCELSPELLLNQIDIWDQKYVDPIQL